MLPAARSLTEGRITRALPRLVVSTIACFALIGAGVAHAGAVIGNGTIELGVNDAGELNYENRGVTFVPTGNDGTRAGCLCEGWGAGNEDADPEKRFSGVANQSEGIQRVTQEGFTSSATTATSTTSVGEGRLQVTHEFEPFVGSDNLFEVKVTLTNTSADTLGDVRYTRLMDWDVEPTPFEEFVTIRRGTTPALLFSNDNGFASNDPLRGEEPWALVPGTQDVDVTDSGPSDHGALFDFGFGALAPDESITFSIFYGAAATTAEADAAISASGAELYSYGKPTRDGAPDNATNTFIFAFRGLGGKPLIPPRLALTPKLAVRGMGTEHTVTLAVADVARNAVPGAPIVFGVTGANPQADSTATTDESGEATFSHTGTTAGRDTIRACLDGDGDGACGTTEVTARARVDFEDPIQPKTLIDAGPADESSIADGAPTFAFSASAPDSTYECRVDAEEFAACTSPVTLDLADGEHTFEVRATDLDENTDASAETRAFTVDTTPPQTAIDTGPADGASTSDDAPAFAFSSDEPGSTFSCVVDEGEPFACSAPHATSDLADGRHTFAVTAADAVGNADATPAVRTFTVDTAAPQTTIASGPSEDDVIADSTPAFGFSASEPGSTFACSVDGAELGCDSPFEPGELEDGRHTFEVRGTDGAGNTDASPASRTFTVDTTSQTTIDSGPADGERTNDRTPTFSVSSGEGGSTYTCSIDADAASACASPFTSTALADGEHTVTVTATDPLGNVDPTPAERTFTVDTIAPQTTIESGPEDGATTGERTPAFSFSSSEDGSTFTCRVDEEDAAPCASGDATAALDTGEHTFEVRATDAAGNTGTTAASRTFVVDATTPQTTIDGGPADGSTTADSTPAFGFTSSEAGSAFACTIDDGPPFACASPLTTPALDDDEHRLTVTATDAVGNVDGSPASRTFTVDTTPPAVAFDDGPREGDGAPDTTPTFDFSSPEAGATFACSIDGGAAFACQSPYTLAPLAPGAHSFTVTATDRSGNREADPTTRRFSVDAAPAAAVAPPAAEPAETVPAATVPNPAAPAATAPVTRPALRSCGSRRRFTITLRPGTVRLVSAVVRVDHKRVATRRSRGRLRATVDLRGLRKGTYAVTVDARDARGRHHRETRRYRVC